MAPKGISFSVVLVINRVSILNRVMFWYSSLKLDMFFLGETTFPSLLIRPLTKALLSTMLSWASRNGHKYRVSNFW